MSDHESWDASPPPQDAGSGAPVEEGAPTWVVTFGDMMSLLLTFFILMFSMSELKRERFLLASQSLREAMGSTAEVPAEDPIGLVPDPVDPELDLVDPGMSDGATAAPVDGEHEGDDPIDVFTSAYLAMIEARLRELVEAAGLGPESVEIVTEEDGVYLRIRDAALFASGQAIVRDDAQALIHSLSRVTSELGVPTIVSGHADARPIRTPYFPSNWELSAARAAGVARVLVDGGQDPETLRVQSFGEHQPVADNRTEEGRARNRRVEIFFSRDAIRDVALELDASPSADPSSPDPADDTAPPDS